MTSTMIGDIREETLVVASQQLTSARLDGEMVVLDLQSGHYFGVNEVGARILELAQEPVEVADIIGVLDAEYDVAPERLRQDVVAFLERMAAKQLVEIRERHV